MLEIQENVPMARYTTFRIGGPARFFTVVRSEAELLEALRWAGEKKTGFFVMGGGSNVLFSDQGFPGLVIKFQSSDFEIMGDNVEVAAGVPLAKVVRETAEAGFSGLEWAAGIPGTIGGAVRGNAGAFGRSMKDSVESVRALELLWSDAGAASEPVVREFSKEECQFDYRDSIFKKNKDLIIFSIRLKLVPGDKKKIKEQGLGKIKNRSAMHPRGFGSAGSFFMNPVVQNEDLRKRFEKEKGVPVRGNKLPAGWLIDQAGLKGKKIGGAVVSEAHADFILNDGTAKAEDVIILEGFVKQQVRDQFDVQLQSEVEHVGF